MRIQTQCSRLAPKSCVHILSSSDSYNNIARTKEHNSAVLRHDRNSSSTEKQDTTQYPRHPKIKSTVRRPCSLTQRRDRGDHSGGSNNPMNSPVKSSIPPAIRPSEIGRIAPPGHPKEPQQTPFRREEEPNLRSSLSAGNGVTRAELDLGRGLRARGAALDRRSCDEGFDEISRSGETGFWAFHFVQFGWAGICLKKRRL
jgi:hypothetical protein